MTRSKKKFLKGRKKNRSGLIKLALKCKNGLKTTVIGPKCLKYLKKMF